MDAIRKQLDIIDEVITYIEMAEKRIEFKEDILANNNLLMLLGGTDKTYNDIIIKKKSLSYWHRRLKREVNKLNELIK
tara:strand:+ start:297 stop:530 length:234 start_codon:yes stop_codon:yes gene_type:complete